MGRKTLSCMTAAVAVLALPVALPAASADVLPGIVSLWAAEGDARDSADGNHGTGQGTVLFPEGRIGSAFELNGSSWIRVPSAANLRVSAGNFTVAAWVNLRTMCADTCDQDIVSKMSLATVPNTDGWRLLKQGDGHFWFCFGGTPSGTNGCSPGQSTTVRSRATAVPGRWFHVVGVKAGNAISIFVNGVLSGTSTMSSFRDTHRAPLTIGAYAGVKGRESGQLNGLIDEPQIYNRALTAAEILGLFRDVERAPRVRLSLSFANDPVTITSSPRINGCTTPTQGRATGTLSGELNAPTHRNGVWGTFRLTDDPHRAVCEVTVIQGVLDGGKLQVLKPGKLLKATIRVRITHRSALIPGCEPGTVGTILATLDVDKPAASAVAVGAWSRTCPLSHFFPNTQGPSANVRRASVWIACLPPKSEPQGWGPRNCK